MGMIEESIHFTFNNRALCKKYLQTAKWFLEGIELFCDKHSNLDFEMKQYVYFLAGCSLELVFKGFLIFKGYKQKQLKDLSHNLEMLIKKTKECGLNILNEDDEKIIIGLNEYYKHKDIMYDLGCIELHNISFYSAVIKKLQLGVEALSNKK